MYKYVNYWGGKKLFVYLQHKHKRKAFTVGSNNSHCQIFEFVSRAKC